MFFCMLKFWSNLSYQLTPSFPSQLSSDLCSCSLKYPRLPFLFKWYPPRQTNGVSKVLNTSPHTELKQLWTLNKVGPHRYLFETSGVSPLYKSFSLPHRRSTTETRHMFAFQMSTLLRNKSELKPARRRGQQEPHKLAYLKMKTVFLKALHVHLQFQYISQPFSSFRRRNEMTCFAVVQMTPALDDNDKFSILSSFVRSADSNLIPGARYSKVLKT